MYVRINNTNSLSFLRRKWYKCLINLWALLKQKIMHDNSCYITWIFNVGDFEQFFHKCMIGNKNYKLMNF